MVNMLNLPSVLAELDLSASMVVILAELSSIPKNGIYTNIVTVSVCSIYLWTLVHWLLALAWNQSLVPSALCHLSELIANYYVHH